MNLAPSVHQLSSRVFLEIIRMQMEIAKAGFDLGSLMTFISEGMQSLTGAHGAAVEMVEGEETIVRAGSGVMAAQLGARTGRRGTLPGRCIELGTVLRCDDTDIDSRVDREACRKLGLRSLLVAPLKHHGHTIGVVKLTAPTIAAFGSGDAHILELMSEMISAAMAREARGSATDIATKATHDTLTGLPNRALFFDRLRLSFELARRDAARLGILLLDIDGLAAINEAYGIRAGDAAIREAAERMRKTARRSDTVARIGGDEFGVILVGAGTRMDGEIHAGRLAEQVEAPFQFEGKTIALKVSIGIAIYPEDGEAIAALMDCASLELERAKAPQTADRERKIA